MSVQAGSRGFTIFELMITVAIASVIATLAVPSFQSFQRNTRMTALGDEALSSLSLARAAAVTKYRKVFWLRTTSPEGWQVRQDSITGLLLAQQTISPGVTLEVIPSVTTPALTALRFESSGLVRLNDTNTGIDVTFRVCADDVSNEIGRDVRLSKLGRLFVAKHASSATCNP